MILGILILIVFLALFFSGLSIYSDGQVNGNKNETIKGILIMISPLIFVILYTLVFYAFEFYVAI